MPNTDEDTPYYQQVPRTGAFEVSYKGMLIFSKLKGGYWPNCELVAEKCNQTYLDEAEGKDCSRYLAGQTPMKGGGVQASSRKKQGSPTPSKNYNNQPVHPFQLTHQAPPIDN